MQGATHYLVTELLEGETLRQKLESGPLPVRRATEYAAEVADGLAAAHAKGVIHRDLKPENVFIVKTGGVKILDFGLAKASPVAAAAAGTQETVGVNGTAPGMVMGTVGYMSPEQVRGERVDHRTDIFSFGAVLYEMVSGSQTSQQHRGRLPFGDERIHSRRGAFGHVDLSRKHDDREARVRAPDLAGYRLPVHLRHAVVQDHKVDGMALQQPQTDPAAAGRDHVVASRLKNQSAGMQALFVVINAEDQLLVAGPRRHLG